MLKINAKHLAIIQLKYPIQTKPHKIKAYMGGHKCYCEYCSGNKAI